MSHEGIKCYCGRCGKNIEAGISGGAPTHDGWFCDECNKPKQPEQKIRQDNNSTKPTNPKDALGIKKAPLHCVPCGPLYELGLAMMEGGRKYGTHNYRAIGVRASTYYNAVMRHMAAWWEGEHVDPDSGVPHIVKAIACLFVLRDSQLMGNCADDRPIRYPKELNLKRLNEMAADLIKKYPDCADPFLEKDQKPGHTKPVSGSY